MADYPLPELDAALESYSEEKRDALAEVADFRIQAMIEGRDWYGLARILKDTAEDIKHYAASGGPPGWFNPEKMSVSPENRELGYNWVHHRPMDLRDRPENNEKYLRERFELVLERGHGGTGTGMEQVRFAKMILAPYLDPEFARNFEKHDAAAWSYFDDGPINYTEPEIPRFLEGDTADPRAHGTASYNRLVRDCLMYRGIVDDVYMGRPKTLAMSLPRNASTLKRLADFERGLAESRASPNQAIDRPEGYAPKIRWEDGTSGNWKEIVSISNGLTDTALLKEHLNELRDYVRLNFRPGELEDSDDVMYNYGYGPRPGVNPAADADHPMRVLLRESVADLYRAAHCLEEIEEEAKNAGTYRQQRERTAEVNLARIRDEHRSSAYVEAMERFFEDYVQDENDPRTEDIYLPAWHQVLSDLGEAMGPKQANELARFGTNYRKLALYDRTLRLLAHADFNLTAVKESQSPPRD